MAQQQDHHHQQQQQPCFAAIHAALQRLHKYWRVIGRNSDAQGKWAECAQQLRSLDASDQEKLDAVLEWCNEGILEHTDVFERLTLELLECQTKVITASAVSAASTLSTSSRQRQMLQDD
jgi:hypothetical protein